MVIGWVARIGMTTAQACHPRTPAELWMQGFRGRHVPPAAPATPAHAARAAAIAAPTAAQAPARSTNKQQAQAAN